MKKTLSAGRNQRFRTYGSVPIGAKILDGQLPIGLLRGVLTSPFKPLNSQRSPGRKKNSRAETDALSGERQSPVEIGAA